VFDEANLVSFAGLAPVLALVERAGLFKLVVERVRFKTTKLASAGANPAEKLTGIIAGMAARYRLHRRPGCDPLRRHEAAVRGSCVLP
jgi:hypothetical protein